MQPSTSTIIECVRDTLSQHIAPACESEHARELLIVVDRALREVSNRLPGCQDHLLAACARQRKLLAEGALLLKKRSRSTNRHMGSGVHSESPERLTSWEDIQRDLQATGIALLDMVRVMRESIEEGEDEWTCNARSWIANVIRAEIDRYMEADRHESASSPTEEADSRPSMLSSYIAERIGRPDTIKEISACPLSGGFSRDTLLISSKDEDGSTTEVVLRREKKGGLIEGVGLPLQHEFAIVKLALRHGLPAPAPLWFEKDESICGDIFFVSERVHGSVLGSAVASSPLDTGTIREIAHTLAKLHATPWQREADEFCVALRQPIGELPTIGSAFERTISRWTGLIDQLKVGPSPALEAAFNWLRTNIPNPDLCPVLVHGDAGIHNMIFREGKLIALLDWELADLGDPARDLLLMRDQIVQHVPWQQFIFWYEESGGSPISDDRARFYDVFISTIGLACQLFAIEGRFESGKPPRIEYLKLGFMVLPHFARRFSQAVAAIAP